MDIFSKFSVHFGGTKDPVACGMSERYPKSVVFYGHYDAWRMIGDE